MEGPLRRADLKLIETMRWDGTRLVRADRHLARLARSASELGFRFDRTRIDAELGRVTGSELLRVRLTLDAAGEATVATAPLGPEAFPWRVAIARERLRSDHPWLRHKTTSRARYDAARRFLPPGMDEILFLNERGEICEGTIANVFVYVDGMLAAPPVTCGLLPGVLREELLTSGRCSEVPLRMSSLHSTRV